MPYFSQLQLSASIIYQPALCINQHCVSANIVYQPTLCISQHCVSANIQPPPTALEQCLTTQVRMLRYLSTVSSIWFVFELSLSCSHELQVAQRDAQSETWVVFEHWTNIKFSPRYYFFCFSNIYAHWHYTSWLS